MEMIDFTLRDKENGDIAVNTKYFTIWMRDKHIYKLIKSIDGFENNRVYGIPLSKGNTPEEIFAKKLSDYLLQKERYFAGLEDTLIPIYRMFEEKRKPIFEFMIPVATEEDRDFLKCFVMEVMKQRKVLSGKEKYCMLLLLESLFHYQKGMMSIDLKDCEVRFVIKGIDDS